MNVAKINKTKEIVQKTLLKNDNQKIDTTGVEPNNNELIAVQPLPDQSPKHETKQKNLVVASPKLVKKQKSESLPPELAQIQKDYDQLIAGQIAYTKSLAVYGESASYFEEFKNDFKILDKKEKELRKSVAQNGLQENSIDDLAMIYQQKLTVLKKLQNEINKTSNRNKNLTDTIPTYISL